MLNRTRNIVPGAVWTASTKWLPTDHCMREAAQYQSDRAPHHAKNVRVNSASTSELLTGRLPAKIRYLAIFILLSLPFLNGCDNTSLQAPEPIPNSNPRATSTLKISVEEGSGVDNVEVRSIWVVGNIGCAPVHPVSGAAIVKQIEVEETVKKIGSYYVATIISDRFLEDKCRWLGGAYEIHFMHGATLMASTGVGPKSFDSAGKMELTCIPPPDIPICELRKKEAFDRAHFAGVFNATVERMP